MKASIQNGGRTSRPELRVLVKRNVCSGKKSYWLWFTKVGSKEFRKICGRDYDVNCEEDRKLIGQLWNHAKELNKLDSQQTSGETFVDRLDEHRKLTTESAQKWRIASNTSVDISSIILRSFPSTSLGSKDMCSRRADGQRYILDKLRFFDANKVDLSTVGLQFLEVLPYNVVSVVDKDVFIYPAEIAITNFTLANGASFCSELIYFDPNLSYGWSYSNNRTNCSYLWDDETAEQSAALVNVLMEHSEGKSPQEVWRQLVEKRTYCEITLCDANKLPMVERALYFLANNVGVDQRHIYEEMVNFLVTVQDFVAALYVHNKEVRETHDSLSSDLSERECIEEAFKGQKGTLRCCRYHERTVTCLKSRQSCPVAKTAVLIDAIYSLCYSFDFAGFRSKYKEEIHKLTCDEFALLIPHSTMTKKCIRRFEENITNQTARDYSQERASVLRYGVVDNFSTPFVPSKKEVVDLKVAIAWLVEDLVSDKSHR